MLETTLQTLREHDFVRGGEQVDRVAVARSIATHLSEDLVGAEDEIQGKAAIVPEISFKLFGDIEDEDADAELTDIVRSLLGAEGQVQTALENGRVLCSATVTRKYDNGAGSVTVRKPGRFVTENDDVAEKYYSLAAVDRAVRGMETAVRRIDLVESRRPALAARRSTLLNKAHQDTLLALGMGGEETP